MRAHGLMARLARLENRLRPKGKRVIVIWWPDEPRPEVPEGGVLIRVVYEDRTESEETSLCDTSRLAWRGDASAIHDQGEGA